MPEPNDTNIEVKEEIVSDEENENTNYFALERYDEKLIEINGTPLAYDYREQKTRRIKTNKKTHEDRVENADESPTSQSWFTCIQPIQSIHLPPIKQSDNSKINTNKKENEQKTDGRTVVTDKHANAENDTSPIKRIKKPLTHTAKTPNDTAEKTTRENFPSEVSRKDNESRSGDSERPATTKRKRERNRASSAEDTERMTRVKEPSDNKKIRMTNEIPIKTTNSYSKKREAVNESIEINDIARMEEKLRELSEKEERLKSEARRLMNEKKRTCQSIARKRNRIRELEGLIRMLKEAPTVDEDSDGDEQLIGMMRTVNQLPKETEYVAEKHIVIDEETGMLMTINASIAISTNIPIHLRDEKRVTITQNVKRDTIEEIIQTDWATKMIRCEMSRDNREIPGTRQILPVGIITKPNTREPDVATPMKHLDDEDTDEQPPESESETIETRITEEQSVQEKNKETDVRPKAQEIKIKEMKIIKIIPKELKQLIDSANNETIIQEKTRRTKTAKSYAESSSDKSNDEICRFRKLSRRKHWNKGSAKRSKSSRATDTTAHPESESSETTITDAPEEGDMRPTTTGAARQTKRRSQGRQQVQPDHRKETLCK